MTRIHAVGIVVVAICALLTFHPHSFGQDAAKAEFDATFKKAKSLRIAGKHAESVVAFQKSLALAEKLFGKDDIETAQVESYLGVALRSAGRASEAEAHAKRALQIREAKLGSDHVEVGLSLNNLSVLYRDLGRLKEAEDAGRRGLKIREDRLPADHLDLANPLHNFGALLLDLEKLGEAEQMLTRSLRIRETHKVGDSVAAALTLTSLNVLYQKLNRFDDADRASRRGIKILEAKDPEGLTLANALGALGILNTHIANHAEAERLYRRSLAIAEKKLGANHPALNTYLANLAVLEAKLDRPHAAEAHCLRGLKLLGDHGDKDSTQVANLANTLGTVYEEMRRFDEAKTLLQRGLEINESKYAKDHPRVASSLNNLGTLCLNMHDYKGAEDFFRRSLQINEAHAKNSMAVSSNLSNLARVYHETNRFKGSEKLLRRSLQIIEANLGKDHLSLVPAMHLLCNTTWRLGRHQEAEELVERCLQISRSRLNDDHTYVSMSFNTRAWVRQGLKRSTEALDDEEECLRRLQHGVKEVFSFASESAMLAHLDTIKGGLPAMLDLAAHADDRDPAAAKAYAWTLRLKGTALDTLCRYRQAQHLVAPDDALAERVARYRVLKHLQANATLSPPQGLKPAEVKEQQAAWRNEAEKIEVELNRAFARKYANDGGDIGNLTAEHVQRQLAPGTALVEYVRALVIDYKALHWNGFHYYAFVLTPDRAAVQLIDLGPADPIEAGVRAVRAQFTEFQEKLAECETREETLALEKKQEKAFRDVSTKLHQRVLAPVQKSLGNARMLYIAADGELNRLPFSALVDADGKYLIETRQCAYLSSGRDLLRKPAKAAKGTVVFAGPDFKADATERLAQAEKVLKKGTLLASRGASAPNLRSKGWAPLPGAAAEAKSIRALLHESSFGPVTAYTGPAAVEDILKAMPAPRVLHLATHGYYLDKEPSTDDANDAGSGAGWARGRLKQADNPLLRSGIVLAGANTIGDKDGPAGLDDGWVTAEEISLLNLQGTELVVLSACQTGLGDIKTGEGVYGLRRAFLYAGARTLVTSLFEVPDRETSDLMNRFFGGLKEGQGKLAALHAAQDQMRRSRAANGAAHPFFWASFVLVGSAD